MRVVRGLAILLVIAGCGSGVDDPPRSPTPTPAPSPIERATPPAPPDVEPPGGAIVARDARGLRVAAGPQGAVVAFGWGPSGAPPRFVASECEWREGAVALDDMLAVAPMVAPPTCDRHRRVYRSWLLTPGPAAVAVQCVATSAIRCHAVTARRASYPDVELASSFGEPSAASFAGDSEGELLLGAWVFDRTLVWVALAPGAEPVVRPLDERLPFSCPEARCAVTVSRDFVNRYAITVRRPDRSLRLLVDRDGRVLFPGVLDVSSATPEHVPPGYSVHPDGTFGDAWSRNTPGSESWTLEGMGSPVLAAYRHRERIAWIRGEPPTATLLAGYVFEGQHALGGEVLTVASIREPGEVAFVVGDSAIVAWTDIEPTGHVVRAALVRAPNGW